MSYRGYANYCTVIPAFAVGKEFPELYIKFRNSLAENGLDFEDFSYGMYAETLEDEPAEAFAELAAAFGERFDAFLDYFYIPIEADTDMLPGGDYFMVSNHLQLKSEIEMLKDNLLDVQWVEYG